MPRGKPTAIAIYRALHAGYRASLVIWQNATNVWWPIIIIPQCGGAGHESYSGRNSGHTYTVPQYIALDRTELNFSGACAKSIIIITICARAINMKMRSTLSSSLLAICLAACFSAAQGENGVLKFMMVGDWGGKSKKPYYTESEGRIADQMGKTAADIGANFTIAVGDNFYDDGVEDVDDKRFKETFEVRADEPVRRVSDAHVLQTEAVRVMAHKLA